MGTLQSLRKAYGALKDSTNVGLAKFNSEFKDLDVAIVKATNHEECPPKERHIRKIFAATSVVRPRADICYCIHALSRRLSKTRNWTVALKILIVIHRTLREGDPTFREELLNYSQRGNILYISRFKDDSSPLAWDCSAWVRAYALFLEERLECFRVLKYDIEGERFTMPSHGPPRGCCRTRYLCNAELLEQLPPLQELLYRLVGCRPEGAAFGNHLIQYALALVLKESFKIYCAVNDGIINLVNMFFEMSRYDAVKALNIYKKSSQQAENLSDFYDFCKNLEFARNFQFPVLKKSPPSFIAAMEEYIKEAPWRGSLSNKKLEYQQRNPSTQEPEKASPSESQKSAVETDEKPAIESQESKPDNKVAAQSVNADTGDLLGLDDICPNAIELEESNASALAIIPSEPSRADRLPGNANDPSEWERALVTTTSSNSSNLTGSKLAGGFDKLLLDSLYDDAAAQNQKNVVYGVGMGGDGFNHGDPFSMSNGIAPPPSVQMALMAQHQQEHMMTTMMIPHLQTYQLHHPQPQMGSTNPFGDPFDSLPQSTPQGKSLI